MLEIVKDFWKLLTVFGLLVATFAAARLHAPAVTVEAVGNGAPCEIEWQMIQAPNIGGLSDVTASGQNDIWALGSAELLHWNGSTWSKIPKPVASSPFFARLGSTGLNRVVAVGTAFESGNAEPAAAWAWNGSGWVRMSGTSGEGSAGYQDVSVLSPLNMWAAGYSYVDEFAPLMAHFTKNKWKAVTLPEIANPSQLNLVEAVSKKNIFAAGTFDDGERNLLLLHKNGSGWNIQPAPLSPIPGDTFPNAMVGINAHDVWVFGHQGVFSNGFAVRYDGDIWEYEDTGLGDYTPLYGADAVGSKNLWAVGLKGSSLVKPLLVHWNGTNWRQADAYKGNKVITEAYLNDVVAIDQNLWYAVGLRKGKSLVVKGTCAG